MNRWLQLHGYQPAEISCNQTNLFAEFEIQMLNSDLEKLFEKKKVTSLSSTLSQILCCTLIWLRCNTATPKQASILKLRLFTSCLKKWFRKFITISFLNNQFESSCFTNLLYCHHLCWSQITKYTGCLKNFFLPITEQAQWKIQLLPPTNSAPIFIEIVGPSC